MKVAFTGPGDFNLGMNSLCRGEGRYLLNMARFLSMNFKNEICILGQNNSVYRDKKYKIYFFNIHKFIENQQTEFDIVFSMGDPFEGIGLEENWMTPLVSKIKAKNRVFMSFFGSTNHYNCTIPVIYPMYYREVDNKKTFCLPIPFGSKDELNKNNFNQKNAIWFSKNSHENPDYLVASLIMAVNQVKKSGGRLVIIDGHKLIENDYKGSEIVKSFLNREKNSVWWSPDKNWLPYNKMRFALSKSKFITGIHHPVCNPMSIEIVFHGGIPILFENQWELPPYSGINIPYIHFNSSDLSIVEVYSYLNDENKYTEFLNKCKIVAEKYTDEAFLEEWNKFLEIVL